MTAENDLYSGLVQWTVSLGYGEPGTTNCPHYVLRLSCPAALPCLWSRCMLVDCCVINTNHAVTQMNQSATKIVHMKTILSVLVISENIRRGQVKAWGSWELKALLFTVRKDMQMKTSSPIWEHVCSIWKKTKKDNYFGYTRIKTQFVKYIM